MQPGAVQALDELGQTRRRLAALLLGTPWAGLLAAEQATAAVAVAAVAPAAPASGAAYTGRWVHGFAAYGQPKLGPDFAHFEYVNPAAPKGGTLKLKNPDRRSSFDKYNPWTVRGSAPAGVLIWMVEGLAHLAGDEPLTMYGLLAEALFVAPDFSTVSFRIHPKARFYNGDPVTPEDVKHSFAMLSGKGAAPDVQTQVSGIKAVVVVDAQTVRFELAEKNREQVFVAGTMPVFSHKWGAGKTLDALVTEYPITSGPYVIDKVDMPRRIEFRRNPDYWGRDLPLRKGHFNFERVIYRMYADAAVAREAFKAGEFDILKEYSARLWVRQHAGPKWDDGRIIKAPLPTRYGQYLQSYQLNLRKPIFQDIRVREALGYTYDFETFNRAGVYKRAISCFGNSEFGAQGLPGPGELALLEPFRAELPPRVFGPSFVAPRTDTAPDGLRRNLLKARELLEQAGWKLDSAGILRNTKGEAFEFEYMMPLVQPINDWQRNLEKLGIRMKDRLVDFALYSRRLRQYDFDMVGIVEGNFTLPQASDMLGAFGSKSADEQGNGNYRGVKSRAADALIEAMARANTMQELRDAARAFDRVVIWNFWQIPDLYAANEKISHWNKFGKPAVMAHYFQADELRGGFVAFAPWPLWTWWDKSLDNKKG